MKSCYIYADSLIVYIKTDDIHRDIAENVKIRFDTSNYELKCNIMDRPLPKGQNKKLIVLIKDEFGRKIMTKFVGSISKTYSYLIDDTNEDKKTKGTKKCVIKRKINFENYKNCLELTRPENFIEENKIDIDSIKENHKNNKSIYSKDLQVKSTMFSKNKLTSLL